MVDVIKFPPVGLTAFEISKIDPISVSKSLFNSKPFVSQFGRSRRVATNVVTGIGYDASGAGYMEMFKEYLNGGVNLIRLDITSSIWHFARAGSNPLLSNFPIEWTEGSTDLFWTTGGTELLWFEKDFYATAQGTNGGFPYITVEGLPPNTMVIRPHELITIYKDGGTSSQRSIRPATSNASGVATIYTKVAFSGIGTVSLGSKESVMFRVNGSLPRAVQPQSGEWTYEWSLEEAFSDEYTTLTEINPWV
tara:strand:- start:1017 stop:1766 length:750 start_codon:yes stop_codon:yes gene_type:complete